MFGKSIYLISFVLALVLCWASPSDAELVGWWRFDEVSGTTAHDSSGNSNDGTLAGNPQWVAGRLDGALDFDGNGDYVDCGDPPELTITDEITFMCWIKVAVFTRTWETIIAKGDNSYRMSRGPGDGDSIHFGCNGPTGGNLNANIIVTDDLWHHAALMYDGVNKIIYIDGVEDARVASTGSINVSTYPLYIGANSQQADRFLDGLVDDVKIYNNALTELEIYFAMQGEGFPYALGPNPADGAVYPDTWVTLSWTPGCYAVSHDVYLGDNFNDVNEGTGESFQGNQTSTFFVAGFPGFAYPEGLVPGTTYYWRIDEVNEANPDSPWKGPIWSFRIPSKKARDPIPADNSKFIDPATVTLEWAAGFEAKLHTVYFSENFDDVNSPTTVGIPVGTTTYDPGPLDWDKTYYWRVDEFDGVNTLRGDVWSFSTVPNIVVTDPNLVAWWKFDEGEGDIALDWSGHGNHGTLHGDPQWVTGQVGGALEFDGIDDYVDCGNPPDLSITGDITLMCWIKVAAFTKTWETIIAKGDDSYRMSRGPGDGDSVHFGCNGPSGGNLNATTLVTTDTWRHAALVYDGSDKIIYIDGIEDARVASTGSINVSSYSLYIGANSQQANRNLTGLVDDVRLFNKALTVEDIAEAMRGEPDLAWDPQPGNGSTPDIITALPLTWSPGDFADQHDVYFGTDKDALDDADVSDATGIYRGRQGGTSYTPPEGVEWGDGPYYWRIDEVNTDGTISEGRIWSFTVADFLLVDDFESYTDNDADGEAIWQHWIDGYGVAGNGSQVGYLLPPYAEQTILHSGSQSMPFFYDNTNGVTNSEAELTLTAPRDWTEQNVVELSLWFRGLPGSVGSFAEGPAGTFTMTGSGADIWGTADQFHYAYKMLTGAGSITARIVSVNNTNAWAKAGVMIRETLDPGSKHAFACITPGNGVASQGRTLTDSDSFSYSQSGITAPHWVKLERDIAGNFSVSHSADGTTWQAISGAIPENISMGSNVYIGLALTSHDAALTCQAVFSNVTTMGTVSGQWANQDIGIESNAAEPLYVAVSNASGSPAVVAHDDPAAAQIDAWMEWRIPLQNFADLGINLRNVDKIAIGLGSTGGVSAGGSGTMYFDDIRLYRATEEPEP